MRYRQDTVSFMRQHRDDFEPFMEDGEDFERYCSRMAQVSSRPRLLILCKARSVPWALPYHCRLKFSNLFRVVQDGTWAGQQEQVALACHYGIMIRVYQADQPAWTIKPDMVPEVSLP